MNPPREPVETDEDETLELTPEMEVDDAEADEAEGDEDETPAIEGDEGEDGDEETVVRFEDEPDEEEAAAGSPVIKRLRDRVKELNAEVTDLRKGATQRQEQELGPKPTLKDFDYDEDKYEEAHDAWKEQKRELEASTTSREAQQRAADREWEGDLQAYASKRDALGVSDFEDAAEIVKSALTLPQQATIIKAANNPAAFVYGLSRSDARLAEIAKQHDPIKLAAVIARMEGGLKVVKRRRAPAPDRPARGSARLPGGTDKQLEKLEAEADKTGNRTALLAYRRKLKKGAK